jgi:hypothetical protein
MTAAVIPPVMRSVRVPDIIIARMQAWRTS